MESTLPPLDGQVYWWRSMKSWKSQKEKQDLLDKRPLNILWWGVRVKVLYSVVQSRPRVLGLLMGSHITPDWFRASDVDIHLFHGVSITHHPHINPLWILPFSFLSSILHDHASVANACIITGNVTQMHDLMRIVWLGSIYPWCCG